MPRPPLLAATRATTTRTCVATLIALTLASPTQAQPLLHAPPQPDPTAQPPFTTEPRAPEAMPPQGSAKDRSRRCPIPTHLPPDDWLTELDACQFDTQWLLALGQRYNALGRYDDAQQHLERALMLAPDSIPIALAYSISLAGSGALDSALALLQSLAPEAMQPTQRAEVQAIRTLLAQSALLPPAEALAASVWQHHFSLRLGRDDNLRGATALNAITLTTPSGPIELPLDPSSRPQPGIYTRADWRSQWLHTSPSADAGGIRRTQVAVQASIQRSPAAADIGSQLLHLSLDSQPHSHSDWLASAHLLALHTQGGTRYQQLGLQTGAHLQLSPRCALQPSADGQRRHLASNPLLSSRQTGLQTWAQCQLVPFTGAAPTEPTPLLYASLRLAHDQPERPDRPGGAQRITTARLGLSASHWQAEIEWTRTRDARGYSPLLDNNLTRQIQRLSWRLQYSHPLPAAGRSAQAQIGLEGYRQNANLALFQIRSTSAYAGLRWRW